MVNKAINTLRVLSAEAISNANSGHGGIALGAAPIMYAAYTSMKIDPNNANWFDRDRFVMSAGHGSALLYSMLHLMGFGISMQDLKTFRKLGSHLTGHPELNTKIGVDCSTGPLGQGVAMAVGMALAEKRLSRMYNKGGLNIIDHHTFVLAGDGCLMEGVSYEACNLAGLWKLNKLIMLYDSNNITIDGTRTMADGECVKKRFEACGWNVLEVDGEKGENDITNAIAQAKAFENAPTIIVIKTTIGYGDKRAGTHKAHGMVLTADECTELRGQFGLTLKPFEVDTDVKKHFESIAFKKMNSQKQWEKLLHKYRKQFPKEYSSLEKFIKPGIAKYDVKVERKTAELRNTGGEVLNQIAKQSVRIYGGSADVASTTKAIVENAYFACGVREFAMAAICNGLALHGFTPYCSTFLAFSDYCKAAIRLTAMMDLPVVYVFTHDGLGNAPDGPTHQGNECINALRMIPNMTVFRPCDDVEAADAYKWAFESGKPTCIVLSRGPVPSFSSGGLENGGYVISDGASLAKEASEQLYGVKKDTLTKFSAVILATGAEVVLCLEAQDLLRNMGISVRVVSMPSFELFDAQPEEYRMSVLGSADIPKVAVEMGNGDLWYKYVGPNGKVISFDVFGESGPHEELANKLGFSARNIANTVFELFKK